jgi:acylpyruvate hydrolase
MKIICIGRNYAEHARELGNAVPEKPVVFLKPSTALLINNKPLYYPDFTQDLHYELEVVLKIVKNGRHVQPEFAAGYYEEVALGIDFTARDLQQACKDKGHPWEIAKAFDHSAALSPFVPLSALNRAAIEFELRKNGQAVQHGNTKDLLFSFEDIIVYTSRFFKLQVGDLIYTGTPAGVGPVQIGDQLDAYLYTKTEVRHLLSCEVK